MRCTPTIRRQCFSPPKGAGGACNTTFTPALHASTLVSVPRRGQAGPATRQQSHLDLARVVSVPRRGQAGPATLAPTGVCCGDGVSVPRRGQAGPATWYGSAKWQTDTRFSPPKGAGGACNRVGHTRVFGYCPCFSPPKGAGGACNCACTLRECAAIQFQSPEGGRRGLQPRCFFSAIRSHHKRTSRKTQIYPLLRRRFCVICSQNPLPMPPPRENRSAARKPGGFSRACIRDQERS